MRKRRDSSGKSGKRGKRFLKKFGKQLATFLLLFLVLCSVTLYYKFRGELKINRAESPIEEAEQDGGMTLEGDEGVSSIDEGNSIDNTDTAQNVVDNTLEDLNSIENTRDTKEVQEAFNSQNKTAVKVKGIYVSGPRAGSREYMDDLIDLVDTTELNAMVIDIKNDLGEVTYNMDLDEVKELGANRNYIRNISELVKELKSKNIYLIARIVAFKDPILAEGNKEVSIKMKDGSIFRDKNGDRWVNPYKKEVWDYLVSVAKEAAEVGFDEIQFDYIRFSTDTAMKDADFGTDAKEKSKEDVITEFTKYAYEKLKPLGVNVSADVFGTIINSTTDAKIVGQDYSEMAKYLDYICPMIYPSHYQDGSYGIEHPDLDPYQLILRALNKSQEVLNPSQAMEVNEVTDTSEKLDTSEASNTDEELDTSEELDSSEESDSNTELETDEEESNQAVVRPWLQDFTATWLDNYKTYGGKEIREQIQAVYDAGYDEWILWNGSNNYTKDGLEEVTEE